MKRVSRSIKALSKILLSWDLFSTKKVKHVPFFSCSVLKKGHLLSKRPNHEEDCSNFCGLLRKAEFYLKKWTACLKIRVHSKFKFQIPHLH